MTRTTKHLLFSLLWLFGFLLIVVAANSWWDISEPGKNQFRSQVASLILLIGFALIFFSWARVDSVEHGRARHAAAIFAIAWPFFIVFTHAAYLFYTRGFRSGLIATVKFVCFILAAGIAPALLFRLGNAMVS